MNRFLRKRRPFARLGFAVSLVVSLMPGASALQADRFHNIENLYGERAPGLGGAYTAISDDPSGAIYNPAGLGFAYNTYISISASNYRSAENEYQDVFGPDQNFSRSYENYFPNFFGAVRDFGDVKLAFVVSNPRGEDYDQSNRIQSPLLLRQVGQVNLDYSEANTAIEVGPGVGWRLSERLSLGASVFFRHETSAITESLITESNDGALFSVNSLSRQRVRSLVTTLGAQYMLRDDLSAGVSVRAPAVLRARRRVSGNAVVSVGGSRAVQFEEGDESGVSYVYGRDLLVLGPPVEAGLPRRPEFRAGLAWYPTPAFLASFDVIHTEGYEVRRNRARYSVNDATLQLRSPRVPELFVQPVTNFAAGVEYYLTETFLVRAGAYTNFANTEDVDWRRSAIANDLRSLNNSDGSILIAPGLTYQPQELEPRVRNEHVDLYGYAFGVGLADATSSISLTGVYETGRGGGIVIDTAPAQTVVQRNFSVHIVASVRR